MTPTRGDRQREIEEILHRFGGDAVESQDLLLAWAAGLEERYDLSQLPDVMHEVKQLLDALEELDKTTTSPGNLSDAELKAYASDRRYDDALAETE